MLDSILVAASGLNAHQKGLKLISNNVANMNTPGYKGDNSQFTDVFLQEAGGSLDSDTAHGGGVNFMSPSINFSSGEIRATGRNMDIALKGPGFFVVQDDQGRQIFTKAGRFEFDKNGKLVTMQEGFAVLANAAAGGQQSTISIEGLKNSNAKATTAVNFSGNLLSTAGSTTSTDPDHTIDGITVFDSMGVAHTVKVTFTVKHQTDATTSTTTLVPGTWEVVAMEGATTLGTGEYKFSGGSPDLTANHFDVALRSMDGQTSHIAFSLSAKATSVSSGTTSDLAKDTVDGNAHGVISTTSIDSTGTVVITYTNGLTAKGPKLSVAEFTTTDSLSRLSGAFFEYTGPQDEVRMVDLGQATTLVGGSLELSNTDLTDQFSNMILIQRGFQASSQVLSTASEMIQSLFDLRSHR